MMGFASGRISTEVVSRLHMEIRNTNTKAEDENSSEQNN